MVELTRSRELRNFVDDDLHYCLLQNQSTRGKEEVYGYRDADHWNEYTILTLNRENLNDSGLIRVHKYTKVSAESAGYDEVKNLIVRKLTFETSKRICKKHDMNSLQLVLWEHSGDDGAPIPVGYLNDMFPSQDVTCLDGLTTILEVGKEYEN